MLDKLLSAFSESNGNLSSMRILNYLVVGAVIFKYLKTFVITYEEIGLILGLLGLKTVQKQIEKSECETGPLTK